MLHLQWGFFEGACRGLPLPSCPKVVIWLQLSRPLAHLLLQQFRLDVVSPHTDQVAQAHLPSLVFTPPMGNAIIYATHGGDFPVVLACVSPPSSKFSSPFSAPDQQVPWPSK